ncbi:hypothetical protein [Ruegeria atlantica]|uniref:hypothetical protein n=1 Tax=Ruegeria atlantica TaxID=81569 RepID=UPI001C2C557E|nr:hypothetical protein [Ruegeria atlantica]
MLLSRNAPGGPALLRASFAVLTVCAGLALPRPAFSQGVTDLFETPGTARSGMAATDTTAAAPVRSRDDILSCPFEALEAAYLSLYEAVDRLNAAALESEVLTFCTERQKRVRTILGSEKEFRALLDDLATGATGANAATVAELAAARTEIERLKAAKSTEIAGAAASAAAPAPGPADPLTCAAPYRVAAILGSPVLGEGLHAVLSDSADGTQMTVATGDILPGGLRVDEITREAVTVSAGGERQRLIPVATRPEVSDGGGLIAEPATVQELFGAPDGHLGPGEGG